VATIRLTEGDFGEGVSVSVGLSDIVLPDTARPGPVTTVPLSAIAAVEALESDHSHQLREAARLSVSGFLKAGPVGLAMGVLGATKLKDVVFSVHLEDGRRFVATADAKTYAEFHAAQVAARAADLMPSPADQIIARYLEARRGARHADAPPANPAPPAPVTPAASAPADTIASLREERRKTPNIPRPEFGRRKRDLQPR
jgi:hypothetical protein